jgi:hypothetical protein
LTRIGRPEYGRWNHTEEVIAMSVVVRYQPQGLTKARYDEVSERMDQSDDWPPDGLDVHVCFGDDGDLLVSEIWDSEEQWRAFRERLMPVLEDAGVQFAGDPQLFDVHQLQKR